MNQSIQGRIAEKNMIQAQLDAQKLQQHMGARTARINTALGILDRANAGKLEREVPTVHDDVIDKANDVLLEALEDAFYALQTSESA